MYDISVFSLPRNFKLRRRLKIGTKKKNDLMYISINKFFKSLGESFTNLLPGLQSMTGCDSVSSFADIGKKTLKDHLKKNIDQFEKLKSFGDSAELGSNAGFLESVFNFIFTLYDKDFQSGDINALRFKLFSRN